MKRRDFLKGLVCIAPIVVMTRAEIKEKFKRPNNDGLRSGRIGRIDNFRIIETAHEDVLTKDKVKAMATYMKAKSIPPSNTGFYRLNIPLNKKYLKYGGHYG